MRKFQKVQAVLLSAALAASASAAVFADETTGEEATAEEASLEAEEAEEVTYPLTLTGTDENTVTLESEPERIVSMGPNMTEILYAIGAGDKLVGRTDYCDYPEEVSEVESVGTIYNADIEALLSLEPDLVLASTHFSEDSIAQLEDAGVPVLYLYDEEDMEGVYGMIELIGEAVNCVSQAEAVVEEMQEKLSFVAERLEAEEENPAVYYVVGYGEYGDYTAGGDTFINGILTAAGAENVAADVEGWSYSVETLLEQDPDYIVLPAYAYDDFCSLEPYTELTAVKEGRVYAVDNNMLDRQGPRNADAVVELAQLLHPDVFPEDLVYPWEEEEEPESEAETDAEELSSEEAE